MVSGVSVTSMASSVPFCCASVMLLSKALKRDRQVIKQGKPDQSEREIIAAHGKGMGEFGVRNKAGEIVERSHVKKSFQNLEGESDAIAACDGNVAFEESQHLPRYALRVQEDTAARNLTPKPPNLERDTQESGMGQRRKGIEKRPRPGLLNREILHDIFHRKGACGHVLS